MHNQTTGSFPLEVSCNSCHHYHFDQMFNGGCKRPDQDHSTQSLDPLTDHCVHWGMYSDRIFTPYPHIHVAAEIGLHIGHSPIGESQSKDTYLRTVTEVKA